MARVEDVVNRLKSLMQARFEDERAAVEALVEEIKKQNVELQGKINDIIFQKELHDDSLARSLARIERALTGGSVADASGSCLVEVEEVHAPWGANRSLYSDPKRRN